MGAYIKRYGLDEHFTLRERTALEWGLMTGSIWLIFGLHGRGKVGINLDIWAAAQ